MIYILVSVLLSMSISLGVGSSTLAILNFFRALADGVIDESERRMMGTVYIVLRVAMGMIALMAVLHALILLASPVGTGYFALPVIQIMWILIGILYLNAYLMTKHIMPSSVGPSLQATTWYGLGILWAMNALGIENVLNFTQFFLGFILLLLSATMLVNGVLLYLKHKQPSTPTT